MDTHAHAESGHTEGCTHVGAGGRAGQIFDCRDTAAGVGGLPRTACESAGERGREGAGTPPKLGDPVTRRVARMLARVGPHSEAISGPTAHVVAERPRIRPSQRRPGPARAPVSATAHLRSSRHFCSQWSLLKWRSRQTSNHTESRSKCMPQPVTNMWKSATDSLYVARLCASRALKHHLLALNGDMPQRTHCALKRPGGNPAPGSSRDVIGRPGIPRRTHLRPPNKKTPLPSF